MDDVAGGVAGGWKRWLRAVSAGRVVAATAAAAVAGAALVAVPALPATAVQSPTACGPAGALFNSGFEQPVVPGDNWQQRTEEQLPG